jgi:hypothetical protein
MTRTALKQAKELHEIVGRKLQNAELLLGAGLLRLSMLDAEISKLCIERAELSFAHAETEGLAAIEMKRRMAAARIDDLKRSRTEAEAECERLRGDTRSLLARKIALDAVLDELAIEQRRLQRKA